MNPFIADVVMAAESALAPSPLFAIGNPSTIVAADPPAPGTLSMTDEKESPIVDETTIAVVNMTKVYGSVLNTSMKEYIVMRAVVAPATGIRPIINPYIVPANNHNK